MADFKLTRRRALGALVTVGAGSAAAGAGTFAFFSDTGTSSGNTIDAGVLTLGSTSDGQLTATDIVPGDSVGSTIIQTTYDSSSTVDPAEVDLSISLSEPTEDTEPSNSTEVTATNFAGQLTVNTAQLTQNGSQIYDLVSNEGVSTVADLDGLSLDAAYSGASPGDTVGVELAFTFDSASGNDYQADGVSIDVTFTAEQSGAD